MRSHRLLVPIGLIACLTVCACTAGPQGPTTPTAPTRSATPPAEVCASLPDDLHGYLSEIEGIISIEVDNDLCSDEGSYSIIIEAEPTSNAAAIKATWDASATAWEELGLARYAAKLPRLSVQYGDSWVETSEGVVRLDDRQAAAVAEMLAGPWQTIFRANLAGSDDYATVPHERRVLRLFAQDDQFDVSASAAQFTQMWQAAAETAEAFGWTFGEIGFDSYSPANVILPVAAGAEAPTGLTDVVVDCNEFSRQRGASISAPDANTVRLLIMLPGGESELDADAQAATDRLISRLNEIGYEVKLVLGQPVE